MTAAGETISVLVADDHEDSLSALAILLRMSGYTVLAARTLSEASALADPESGRSATSNRRPRKTDRQAAVR